LAIGGNKLGYKAPGQEGNRLANWSTITQWNPDLNILKTDVKGGTYKTIRKKLNFRLFLTDELSCGH